VEGGTSTRPTFNLSPRATYKGSNTLLRPSALHLQPISLSGINPLSQSSHLKSETLTLNSNGAITGIKTRLLTLRLNSKQPSSNPASSNNSSSKPPGPQIRLPSLRPRTTISTSLLLGPSFHSSLPRISHDNRASHSLVQQRTILSPGQKQHSLIQANKTSRLLLL
jgi:hypothetical protein